MSDEYTVLDLSLAHTEGHNDGWTGRGLKPAPNGVRSDRRYQNYISGYNKGNTAKYYHDKGYEAGIHEANAKIANDKPANFDNLTLDEFQMENGVLVKVRGARPSYMSGYELISVLNQLGKLALN